MTKTERICALYDGKRTTREIAEIVGCALAYVRVVARQRKGRGCSDNERRYLASSLGRATKRAYRLGYREYDRAYSREYHRALRDGCSREQASERAKKAAAPFRVSAVKS